MFKCNVIETAFINPLWHTPVKLPRTLEQREKHGSLELILSSILGWSFKDTVSEIEHLCRIMVTCSHINAEIKTELFSNAKKGKARDVYFQSEDHVSLRMFSLPPTLYLFFIHFLDNWKKIFQLDLLELSCLIHEEVNQIWCITEEHRIDILMVFLLCQPV